MSGFSNGGNATELQGEPISTTTPTSGQVLSFNGTAWTPSTGGGGGITALTGDVTASGTGSVAATLVNTTNVESIISANATVSGALQTTGGVMSGAITYGYQDSLAGGSVGTPTAIPAAQVVTLTPGLTNNYYQLGNDPAGTLKIIYNLSTVPVAYIQAPSGGGTIDGYAGTITIPALGSWQGIVSTTGASPTNWLSVKQPGSNAFQSTPTIQGTTVTTTGEIKGSDFSVTGTFTGYPGRYLGSTASGSPTGGTYFAGDYVVDLTGTIWVCVTGSNVTYPNGIWTNEVPNSLVTRTATATAGTGEFTIFSPTGTSGQTITLPVNPVNGATYQIKNLSAYTVNIKGGTNSVSVSGILYTPSTSYTIPLNAAYTFVYNGTGTGGTWYCFTTTDIAALANYSSYGLQTNQNAIQNGVVAQTFDVDVADTTASVATTVTYVASVYLIAGQKFSNYAVYASTSGSSGAIQFALYYPQSYTPNPSGYVSNSLYSASSVLVTSGLNNFTITPLTVPVTGLYYIGFSDTSGGSLVRTQDVTAAYNNVLLNGSAATGLATGLRFGTITGTTTLSTTNYNTTTINPSGGLWWIGLY